MSCVLDGRRWIWDLDCNLRCPSISSLRSGSYCERADNRDGRGVRSATVAEICKTLRHLRSAARRATVAGSPERARSEETAQIAAPRPGLRDSRQACS